MRIAVTNGASRAVRRTLTSAGNKWSDSPGIDLWTWVIAISLLAIAVRRWPHIDVVLLIPVDQRLIAYAALATVASLAAGANNTAIGAYAGSSGTLMQELRRSHGLALRKNLRSVGLGLWATTTFSLLAIVLDAAANASGGTVLSTVARWLFISGLALSALKFLRLTFVQDIVLEANDLSGATNEGGSDRRALTVRQRRVED